MKSYPAVVCLLRETRLSCAASMYILLSVDCLGQHVRCCIDVSLTDAMQVAEAYPGGGGHLGWIHRDGHQDHSPLQGYSKDLLPFGA